MASKKQPEDLDRPAKKSRKGSRSAPKERTEREDSDVRSGGEAVIARRSGPDVGGLALPGHNLIGPGALVTEEPPSLAGAEAAVEAQPAELGATKYVHAAFFVAGILIAFLSGKVLGLAWSLLADWHAAVQVAPFLLRWGEGQRGTVSALVGVGIGIVSVIQTYRRAGIRKWADDVAMELARVTWPNKETVTNGTIIVIVASIVATTYVSLLDQFWGFVTRFIYEA